MEKERIWCNCKEFKEHLDEKLPLITYWFEYGEENASFADCFREALSSVPDDAIIYNYGALFAEWKDMNGNLNELEIGANFDGVKGRDSVLVAIKNLDEKSVNKKIRRTEFYMDTDGTLEVVQYLGEIHENSENSSIETQLISSHIQVEKYDPSGMQIEFERTDYCPLEMSKHDFLSKDEWNLLYAAQEKGAFDLRVNVTRNDLETARLTGENSEGRTWDSTIKLDFTNGTLKMVGNFLEVPQDTFESNTGKKHK